MKTLLFLCVLLFQTPSGTLTVQVRSEDGPVSQVEVQANAQTVLTNERGEATLELPAGVVEVHFRRVGFADRVQSTTVIGGQSTRLQVELEEQSVIEEEIVVTATRANTRIEDEPIRIEVVDHEEVDEKAIMTPGNVAMLLNETGGLRVQVTSASLGAANVRVQGLRGRYTQMLADGLPLYGQTGSIGILQIPPLDLGRVEVIKGVASALYGSSALGGVVNLVSRKPAERQHELLVNATSRKGSDTVFWLSEPASSGRHWGYTLLGGAHFQAQSDIDGDGWSDLPEYQRGVVRPRVFWNDDSGNSWLFTVGAVVEDRAGGSDSFKDAYRTRRFDGGAVGRYLLGKHLLSIRASVMSGRYRREFGAIERDRQQTLFGEASLSSSNGRHTWTVGSAFQTDRYKNRDVPRFDYTFVTPGVFAQDEYSPTAYLTVSASGRLDVNNRYGTFFNPRLTALIRLPLALTVRLSAGTGVFTPTPFTEETEATGLMRILPLRGLREERARSFSGDLGWKSRHLELNATAFGSIVRDPVALRGLEIVNLTGPTRTVGSDFVARLRYGRFNVVASHTYVHSTEVEKTTGQRDLVPLTPRYTAGIDMMWEDPDRMRVGFEVYYTGLQRLEDNPYRTESIPYWVYGLLIERRVGPFRLFLNAENIGDVRQTRHDPLVLPEPLPDGRRTVGVWGPLEGRILNGGLRYRF